MKASFGAPGTKISEARKLKKKNTSVLKAFIPFAP
jgi:hypothetical protein